MTNCGCGETKGTIANRDRSPVSIPSPRKGAKFREGGGEEEKPETLSTEGIQDGLRDVNGSWGIATGWTWEIRRRENPLISSLSTLFNMHDRWQSVAPVRNKDLIRLPIISYLAFQRATNNWI